MPRTTVNIDATVLAELKERAQQEHKSLGDVISEVVARQLAEQPSPDHGPFRWVSAEMRARVDLDDKQRLRDLLDEP